MKSISDIDIQQFWGEIFALFERVRPGLAASQRWHLLNQMQSVEQASYARMHDNSLSSWVSSFELIREVRELLQALEPFDAGAAPLAQLATELAEIVAPLPTMDERHEALARRLFSMHSFLDGVAGTENYGAISADRDADLRYGLGLHLKDGSLHKFLSRLDNPESGVIAKHFEDDSESLIEAIHEGQTSFEQYMQSQLILRYDPMLSRKIYSMSDTWQARFERLGKEPQARATQLDLVAGERFKTAKRQAQTSGIQSLRGFAMLFDLDKLASDEVADHVEQRSDEADKCLSLADEVIARMHGHVASHWQSRLFSVMHGSGVVDDRYYDETQFLGHDAAEQDWASVDFSLEDERDTPEPCSGHTYVICRGDRLSHLVEKAYGNDADYRLILRQNPQILQPENLVPGMRIYFPEIHTVQRHENRPADFSLNESDGFVGINGRRIGPLTILTPAQIQTFRNALSSLSPEHYCKTVAVEMPTAVMITCGRTTLFLSDDANAQQASRLRTETSKPLLVWANHIAAQIRGDIEIDETLSLPLATIASQPMRREWFAEALKGFLKDKDRQPPRIVLLAKNRCVDIVDALDQTIVRLENEDFRAIREQPWRRLTDYVATPIVQMDALTQIWLGDLMYTGCEIAVPPISHANQYSFQQLDDAAHFIVPIGTPVYPIMRGTVLHSGRTPGDDADGYTVLIQHRDGLYSRYSSLATINVVPGQIVSADTMIARSGSAQTDRVSEPGLLIRVFQSDEIPQSLEDCGNTGIDYFDFIYHLWPQTKRFECIMDS